MFEEHGTSRRIQSRLTELGVRFVAGLAAETPGGEGTGVVGFVPATHAEPAEATTIALRADIDALPINEETGLAYASGTPGRMHACGHDGHTAILLAAAEALLSLEDRPHNVVLLFQPAEEGGFGAEKLCDAGALDGTLLERELGVRGARVDMVYGLHAWPEIELGKVGTRTGPLLASTDEFDMHVRVQGGHGAMPHTTVDPVVVAAHIVTSLQTVVARRVSPNEPAVLTVAAIHAGEANNVIPDCAEMRGTLRALSHETRRLLEDEFKRVARGVGEALGASIEIDWQAGYPVTHNEAGATERFRRVARAALGEANVIERPHPTMGGEDFSYYGQHCPASFFLLGLRPATEPTYPGLHTPTFNFNDDALPIGAELMVRLAVAPIG
jgi:amidohydrolase